MLRANRVSNREQSSGGYMAQSKPQSQVRGVAAIDGRSFLEDIRIDHGPARELGRFFLTADTLVRAAGIQLRLVSIKDASQAHTNNKESWPAFPPMLDSRLSHIDTASSYALLGYNQSGEVVSSQAGRIYETPEQQTLPDMIGDQSFLYGGSFDPQNGHPTCHITAPSSRRISGRYVYSGALWVRPDYRGHRLANILPRVSRAYALSRWNTDFTIAFIGNATSSLCKLYGYPNIEPGVEFRGLGPSYSTMSLMWMTTDQLVEDLETFMGTVRPQVDGAVSDRPTQHDGTFAAEPKRQKNARVS
jgi:hypothetical protein